MPPKKKAPKQDAERNPEIVLKQVLSPDEKQEEIAPTGNPVVTSLQKEVRKTEELHSEEDDSNEEDEEDEDNDNEKLDDSQERTKGDGNDIASLISEIKNLYGRLEMQALEIKELKAKKKERSSQTKRERLIESDGDDSDGNETSSMPPSISRKGRRQRRHKRSALLLTPMSKYSKVSADHSDDSADEENESEEEDYPIKMSKKNKWQISVAPDKFKGNLNEDIRVWLFQYEQCMIINQVPRNMWTQLSFPYLKDNAATWYLSRFHETNTKNFSWNKFKKMIKTTFEPYDNSTLLRTKLKSLKQGNDLDVYIKEMRLILMQLPDMSEKDKIEHFIDGLKTKTQQWIRYERAQTLEEAIEYATSFERSFFGIKPKEIKSKHSVRTEEHKSKPKQKIECYLCKNTGHYASSCPNKRTPLNRPQEKKEVRKTKQEEKIISNLVCSKEECWMVKGFINNIPVQCLIDTGADANHISTTFVESYRFVPEEKNEKIRIELGIDNVMKEYKKKEIDLDINLKVVTSKEKFYVWDINKKFDVILGYPYFKKHSNQLYDLINVNGDAKKERFAKERKKNERKKKKQKEEMIVSLIAIREERDNKSENSTWIENLLNEYESIVSDDVPLYNSKMPFEHKIELVDESIPKKRLYRLSPREIDEMNKQIKEMLDKGLIQKSESPYGSPIVFAKKSDGSLRMCIDYRALNQRTKLNRYPLPNIQQLFDIIGKAKIYSKLDLKSGYYQIRMQKGSVEFTAFITPFGHYEWLVMPFGLTNAPSTFQSAMNELLREFLNVFVVVYLDDIVIFSNSIDEHREHIRLVMNKLKECGLIIAKKKCEWERKKIRYLGHVIGDGKIKPDDQKVEIVKNWKRPENIKQVQRFIGFINYYNQFINNFAKIAKPLFMLLRKDCKFEWKSQHEKSFGELKNALLDYQSLMCPDVNKPFTIYTDASDVSIGSVLMQETENGLETVSMRSRCLKGSELNYSTYDKELLAIHDAFMNWRHYLDGNSFIVMTDHNPLVHLFKQERLNSRQVRWINELWNQKIEIKYVKGKENVVADALSRLQINHISSLVIDEEFDGLVECYKKDSYFKEIWNVLSSETSNENEVKKKKVYCKRFKIDEGKLFCVDGNSIRLCLPKGALRSKVLHTHHESLVGGHQGIVRTYELISKKFYFPRMRKIIDRYISSCIFCQRNKSKNQSPIGLLQPLEIPEEPWDTVTMDFIVRLPMTKNGNDAIVVFVCKLTKRIVMRALKTTASASDVAKIYMDAVVREHGLSKNFICDRDSKFTSKFWKAFVDMLGIKLKMSTAFHPETDGQTERANRIIQDCLRHYVNFEQNNWDELLSPIEYVLNSCKQLSTNYTPFELDYGRKIRYPTDLLLETQLNKRKFEDRDVEKMIKQHRVMIQDAIESLRSAQINQQIQANRKRKDYDFKVGDKVMLRTKNYLSGEKKFRPKRKLAAKWAGPFELIEKVSSTAFRVRLPPKWQIHDVIHVANFWPAVVDDKFELREDVQPPPDLIEGMEEYEVEAILKRRVNKKTKETEYLVMWKGYPDDVSWEKEANVEHCKELVDEFNRNNGYTNVTEVNKRQDEPSVKPSVSSRGRKIKKKVRD